MIRENLPLLESNKAPRIPQDHTKFLEYWEKRTPEDGLIDLSIGKENKYRLIRAVTRPYPGAFLYTKNRKLIIWGADYDKSSDTLTIKEIEWESENPQSINITLECLTQNE